MQFIVDFKNDTSETDIQTYLSTNNATIIKVYSNFQKTYLVEAESKPPVAANIEYVIEDSDNPIQLLGTTIISDQTFGKKIIDDTSITIHNTKNDWWKSFVVVRPDFENPTYQIPRRGHNSTVYVLDSGIDLTHPDFTGCDISNLFSFTGDFTDTTGHGTGIASIIGGNTCGITNAKIKSVKIFDASVPTRQSHMLEALDTILTDLVTNGTDYSILNCSFTMSKNAFIESKLQNLIDNGVYIVAAAGNSGQPIIDISPAGMPDVVTIGAFDPDLKPCDFSNYTDPTIASLTNNETNYGELDGWAPGIDIYAANKNGSYGFYSGTSAAAAIQTAALAYALSYGRPAYRGSTSIYNDIIQQTLYRVDLLELTDPKYQTSANKISSISTDFEHHEIFLGLKTYGKGGNFLAFNLFNPRETVSVEFLEDLPSWVTVDPTGKMYGVIPEITEPYEVINVPMKVITTQNEILNETLEIIILHQNHDPAVGTGDPIIDLKTAFQCDTYSQSCGPYCDDFCASPFRCYMGFDTVCKPDYNCTCVF